jgi:hypothetical protein
MDQKIAKCGKGVLGHSNFKNKKEELEKLLSVIINRTSESGTSFKNIEARGFAESPNVAELTKIAVDQLDPDRQRITVRIQLVGCIERWIIDIPLRQGINQKSFHREIRKASADVCVEESKKNSLPNREQKKSALPPDPKIEEVCVDTATIAVVTVPQAKEKRTRRNASSLVPDELVLKILLGWLQLSNGVQTLDQREFWGIAISLGILKKDVPTVLAILKRKLVIEEISIKYKPQIKIAQLGLDLLAKQKQLEEAERLEAEKSSRLQRARNIPKLILSPFKKVRDAQAVQAQLGETRTKKEALVEKIEALRAELVKGEKELIRIKAREKNQLGEIEKLLSQINSARVAEMIEIGEEAFRQKDVEKEAL